MLVTLENSGDVSGNQEKPAPQSSGETGEQTSDETSEARKAASEDAKEADSEGDEQESEAEGNDAKDENGEPRGKEQKGFGKRISKLVKKNQNLSQELEYWKNQAIGAHSGKEQAGSQKAAQSKEDARPRADDFDSYEDYQVALSAYGARKALGAELDEIKKTLTGSKTESEAEKASKAFDKRTKEFVKEHKDYAEVLQALSGIEVDKSVEQAIVLSEHGPALLYELGNNPDLAESIAELPPVLQFKEIVKLEQKIEARKNAAPKTTKAPPPPKPVGAKSEGKKSIYDSNLSFAEYERIRKEQLKSTR